MKKSIHAVFCFGIFTVTSLLNAEDFEASGLYWGIAPAADYQVVSSHDYAVLGLTRGTTFDYASSFDQSALYLDGASGSDINVYDESHCYFIAGEYESCFAHEQSKVRISPGPVKVYSITCLPSSFLRSLGGEIEYLRLYTKATAIIEGGSINQISTSGKSHVSQTGGEVGVLNFSLDESIYELKGGSIEKVTRLEGTLMVKGGDILESVFVSKEGDVHLYGSDFGSLNRFLLYGTNYAVLTRFSIAPSTVINMKFVDGTSESFVFDYENQRSSSLWTGRLILHRPTLIDLPSIPIDPRIPTISVR